MIPTPQVLKTLLPLMTGATLGATTRHLATVNATHTAALRRICMINTAGSFVLGMTQSLHAAKRIPAPMALAVGTGFCGALTTFSTFAVQVYDMLPPSASSSSALRKTAGLSRFPVDAALYVFTSVLFGVFGVTCGRRMAEIFIR